MHTTTISSLAGSRVSYYKSRSILTIIAIMLTTALLAGLVTGGLGVFDITRQQAAAQGNYHAVFQELSSKQLEQLNLHLDVESLRASCSFATVTYDDMNGFLSYQTTYKEGIYQGIGNLAAGRLPETPDEICAPPSFFERMGAEPAIGARITIPFRVEGKGKIQTREFTICGLMTQIDLSGMEISDRRIVYSALISEALADEYLSPEDRTYDALVRVSGENSLHYDEITDRIAETAADIDCKEQDISFHTQYLSTMTAVSAETTLAVVLIGLIVLFFSALVIYSIYYVNVITDVQELGKLKALGASRKQVKKLLLSESMRLAVIAIPPGLLLGFAIPAVGLSFVLKQFAERIPFASAIGRLHLFSPPALTIVVIAVLLTIRISLQKPLHMAGKISPTEAIRYQEGSAGGGTRRGFRNINLFRLCCANLLRNKKRTFITILSMGLSCVLFITLSAVLSSMDPENVARIQLARGDFRLGIECSWNDMEYPENNFDSLQQKNLFNDSFLQKVGAIDGVKKIEKAGYMLAGADPPLPLFSQNSRKSVSSFSREELEDLQKDVLYGEIDYEKMLAENGVIFTADLLWDDSGLAIGNTLPLTLYDGGRQIPLTVTVSAVVRSQLDYDNFLLPEELWENLDLRCDTTSDLFIYAEPQKYDKVKTALQEITAGQKHFYLYSIDEEIALGKMSVSLLKLPAYVILIMTAVISCINLVNTMITSIVTRKRELGVLQALGLSGRQLKQMLSGEGLFFTAGTLLTALTVGNLFGYLSFLWAKSHYISGVKTYHYPFWETVGLTALLVIGQLLITGIMNKRLQQESLIDRIRSGE